MNTALQSLLAHAERERDAAQAALAEAEGVVDALARQAEQLADYRADYDSRHPARGGRSAPIEVLRCHLSFMQRLEQAQAQQQGQLDAARLRATQRRATLLARQTRVAAVKKLMERRDGEVQRHAQRAEQRRHDEIAQQRAWHSPVVLA